MEKMFPVFQIMDANGRVVSEEHSSEVTEERVMKSLKEMIRIRMFDKKAISLQRQGRIGTYAPYEGQEASQAGSAMALKSGDWLFPTYRDHGAAMIFGHSLKNILLFWNGRNEGCVPPEGKKIFPPAIPIATQIPHAAGAALAEKMKGSDNAALCYFGDGATSEGDFHEGLNFASVFGAPVVYFNQNNQYAISVPLHKQMKSETIAQKAVAYSMPGVRVDGNDIFAVYFQTAKALSRARRGEGPTLIEALTWRYGAHTTADDPSKYRSQEDSAAKRLDTDPILRLERWLKNNGLYDENWFTQTEAEAADEIDAAIEEMESFPKGDPSVIFDYVFEKPTWTISKQKADYLNLIGGGER
ncbi:pyruvate dehydrogenase (acetyl-transferring) E1 component subunit alpha [Bacillus lacus]|uniref:Pyruvate dehydrogenase E1 component subunit alpha n=1 Tax=Metabacillus lacus TaxID=1983721 RepID=A0A7X2IXW5_9BACI|nr:pyruvate dehydrogenase (acetyl-transferring) E1 component subunit alpha [Metabacillus lacus]MRX71837.1 pyruvate dehydrogenase (acetyl-transferring) E1 component subunit alpha [Metabacillus lacus]